MNGLFLSFLFLIFSHFKITNTAIIDRNHDFRIADPSFNAICQSHSKQVFYLSQKIICIFCKGFDVSCFPTPAPAPVTTTAKPAPSSSVKSTLPVSSSVSVSSTKSAIETTAASEPPDA